MAWVRPAQLRKLSSGIDGCLQIREHGRRTSVTEFEKLLLAARTGTMANFVADLVRLAPRRSPLASNRYDAEEYEIEIGFKKPTPRVTIDVAVPREEMTASISFTSATKARLPPFWISSSATLSRTHYICGWKTFARLKELTKGVTASEIGVGSSQVFSFESISAGRVLWRKRHGEQIETVLYCSLPHLGYWPLFPKNGPDAPSKRGRPRCKKRWKALRPSRRPSTVHT